MPNAGLPSYSGCAGLIEQLAKTDPNNAGWHRDLSASLKQVGASIVNTSRALPRKSRRARHLGECGFRWLLYDNQTVLTNGDYGSGRERCTFF